MFNQQDSSHGSYSEDLAWTQHQQCVENIKQVQNHRGSFLLKM